MKEEAKWQVVVLIPTGGGNYLRIGIVDVVCKACRSTGIPPVATVPVNMFSRSVLCPGQG